MIRPLFTIPVTDQRSEPCIVSRATFSPEPTLTVGPDIGGHRRSEADTAIAFALCLILAVAIVTLLLALL